MAPENSKKQGYLKLKFWQRAFFCSLALGGYLCTQYSTNSSAITLAEYKQELIGKYIPTSVTRNYSSILVGRFNYWQDLIKRSVIFDTEETTLKSYLNSSLFLQKETFDLLAMHPDHESVLLKDAKINIQNWDIIETMNHNISDRYKLGSGFVVARMNTHLSKENIKGSNWRDYSYGSGRLVGLWAGMYTDFENIRVSVAAGNFWQDMFFDSDYRVMYRMNYFKDSGAKYQSSKLYALKLPMSEMVVSQEPQNAGVSFLNVRAGYSTSFRTNMLLNIEANVTLQNIRLYQLTQNISSSVVAFRDDNNVFQVVQFDAENDPGKFYSQDTDNLTITNSAYKTTLKTETEFMYSVPVELKVGISTRNILTDSLQVMTYVAGSLKFNAFSPHLPSYYYSYLLTKTWSQGENTTRYQYSGYNDTFSSEDTGSINALTYGLYLGLWLRIKNDFFLDISYRLFKTTYEIKVDDEKVENLSHGVSLSLQFQW